MLDVADYIILFFLGSLGGFISGFLGVGGGIVFIPILDYYLSKMGLGDDKTLVKAILANSLFTIIFSGFVSSYKQYRTGNFFPKEIFFTALPGLFTSLLLTWFIKQGNWYSKTGFNYVFACMMLVIIIRMLTSVRQQALTGKVPSWKFSLTGFFAGIITAFSGLGGGVIMTPVFTDILKLDIRKASSISNGVIPLFALLIGIYNLSGEATMKVHRLQIGYIVFPLVLPMIISVFLFAPLGVRMSQKTKPEWIRITFASFTTIIFIKTIYELFFH